MVTCTSCRGLGQSPNQGNDRRKSPHTNVGLAFSYQEVHTQETLVNVEDTLTRIELDLLVKKLMILNPVNGEVSEETFIQQRPRHQKERNFVIQAQDMMDRLLDLRLTQTDYRVLVALMSRCTWANQCYVRRSQLAERLNMSTQQLWRSLRNLRTLELIYWHADNNASFSIDPQLCWRSAPHERGPATLAFRNLFAQD